MRVLWRSIRLFLGAFRGLVRTGVLLVVLVMFALNVATLVFPPLSAAAGAMLARAGITTVAAKASDDLTNANRRIAAQADDLTAAKRRIDAERSELTKAKRRIAAQADELTSAKRRIAAQGHDLSVANRRIAAQGLELRSARTVRYRGRNLPAREAVANTAERVARRTATAAARNVAAIPAESLPFLGVAVILGATAWELRDACALMQDMHELNVAFDPSLANDPARIEACGHEVPSAAEVRQRIFNDPAGVLDAQPEEFGAPTFEMPDWWLQTLAFSSGVIGWTDE